MHRIFYFVSFSARMKKNGRHHNSNSNNVALSPRATLILATRMFP